MALMAAVTHLDHVDSHVGQQFKTGVTVVGKPHAVILCLSLLRSSLEKIFSGETVVRGKNSLQF
jgi:hypothetical protein